MSDENELRAKVKDMAKLSMLANKITEVQEKNLKLYPFVFFEGVKSARIDYDLSNNMDVDTTEDQKNANIGYKVKKPETKHLRISYYLELDEGQNSNLDKRFGAIEGSVRNLFWNQIAVEVYFNNELKYKSK